jgi:uncharacterized membrane protein YadS
MIPAIAVIPFCVLVPVLVIWLGERHTIVDKIGAAILCYAIGILVGNLARFLGLIPETATELLDTFSTVAVAIALPLIYFSLNVRNWGRAGPKALLSFAIEIVAVLVASGSCCSAVHWAPSRTKSRACSWASTRAAPSTW